MAKIENVVVGLSVLLLNGLCFSQQEELEINTRFETCFTDSMKSALKENEAFRSEELHNESGYEDDFNPEVDYENEQVNGSLKDQLTQFHTMNGAYSRYGLHQEGTMVGFSSTILGHNPLELELALQEKEPFFNNRRNVYSSLWAFASLNYLYADLVGLMDKNKLVQYQAGEVDGLKITPEFLTIAAGFMQIPIANVFLPHIIKNEKTLRWVQIASGTVMTLVQSGTLFVGKPTPYYVLFSSVEIAATTYITIDAIRWKPNGSKKKVALN